jgi:hypothetical protein
MLELRHGGRFWDSGPVDLPVRFARLDAELTAMEFQVWPRDAEAPLDAWSAKLQLPAVLHEGRQIAVPLWLEGEAVLSELWPLYSVGGERRGSFRVGPGYAKEGASRWDVDKGKGLTFRLPLSAADAGRQVDVTVVSARPVARGEVWLVTDPLPYARKAWRS